VNDSTKNLRFISYLYLFTEKIKVGYPFLHIVETRMMLASFFHIFVLLIVL